MFTFLKIIKKIVVIFIILLFFVLIFSQGHVPEREELKYGVTFSKKQAIDLGLDWQDVYLEMISDLGVKKLRISAYWDLLQSEEGGEYDWVDLDWQIEKASENNVEMILAVGGRLPRWPECHYPEWVERLEKKEREENSLGYIEAVINRYKDNDNIVFWQVENEPFLRYFGECPEFDRKFLDQEIALVRSLDKRPIVVTDSGELSLWVPAAKRADVFGTTMYLNTYSAHLERYVSYPITPAFFRFKKNIARVFSSPEKWIVIEMQGEPWGPKPFQHLTKEERDRTMDLEKFLEMIEFGSKTGFGEFYLWGVEWWSWEKETQNNPEIWDEARELFR